MIGFFLGGIPWYVGAFIVLFVRVDYREKPGYVACAIAVSIYYMNILPILRNEFSPISIIIVMTLL